VKILRPTSFEIVVRTHSRVSQSIPGWMFDYFEEVRLSKALENIVELGRPSCSEIVARPLAGWHLYSFLTQIFLHMVVLGKEYRKRNREMNIVKIIDKVVENWTRGGESPLTL